MARKPLAEFAKDVALDEADDHDLVLALEQRGFTITKDMPTDRRVELSDRPSGKVRFGVVSDTHFGHRKQQLTYLRDFYDQARDWGAEFMLHGGDVVDGQNMHRDQQFELFKHGVAEQGRYAAEVLPELRNKRGKVLPTHVIGGNHDGSGFNDAGANVFDTIKAAGRTDVRFLGAPTATFHYGPLRIRITHPDGGVPYARSYRLQKAVEQLPPDDKPHLYLFGHWHVCTHVPGYRNVEAISLPCFQAQTSYIARKQLSPVIGGVLFEAEFSERGLDNLLTKWVLYRTPIVEDY